MTRKRDALALAAVLALVTLAFADLLTTKRAMYVRDISRIYLPQHAAFRDAVRDGLPLWNPRFGAGQPMAANPEYEVFYPPHWLALLPNLLLGFSLELVVHYGLAAAGMFLFLRRLGLHGAAAAFGALSFALGGVMLSLANLLPYLFALTWWPWLGLFADRFFEHRRAGDFALAALALGMVVLIGEPSTIIETAALLGAFALARARPAAAIGWTAAIGLAALLAGAAQIVPTIDFSGDTTRATALDAAGILRWSLAPTRPLEILGLEIAPAGPRGVNWVVSWYGGMFAAALMLAGFAHRVRGWLFAALVTIAAYALALGTHSPLFRALVDAGFMRIRYPEKWFLPAAFVLIVFAAIAADRFLDDVRFRRTTHVAAAALIAVNAAGGLTRGLAMAAVLALALFLRGRLLYAALGALLLVDLGAQIPAVAPRIDARFYTEPPAIARGVPPRSRIYNDADWAAYVAPAPPPWRTVHEAMLPEIQTLWGFDSVLESDVTLLFLRPTAELERLFLHARGGPNRGSVALLLSLAGATHVVTPDGAMLALHNEKVTIAAALAPTSRIAETHPWPRGIAFVDRPFAPAPARIVGVRETSATIDADVEAEGRALLVIAVTPHKYWRGAIDGAPAPLIHANVGFQAIEMPRGRHHLSMRYRNPLVAGSALVSLIAAAALATVAALRSRAPRPPWPR